ncbi:hypothetical protein B9G54_02330 [Alloscardovia macacae]|uniref:Transcriptional regulator n=1 Tax=Alloscardovia macacae TaxID=1160091 RepID=A0A1Y2SYV1_9BIFI|nr:Rrf2 family transcriptional regulator [Alloscardovia macacae]OTA27097.1 hypothetical protein B9G54_02330 [Alloscardovia macacae]OTA29711.1 hypothetical protein B9T39_02425 [Alloscardovia macacae]
MNLSFTIALHALTFLLKHDGECFSSTRLAELMCVNPAQLRAVMKILVAEGYVQSSNGKLGGYSSTARIAETRISEVFDLFRAPTLDSRTLTGKPDSTCEIARNMSSVVSDFAEAEYRLAHEYYTRFSISDILNTIHIKEDIHDKHGSDHAAV